MVKRPYQSIWIPAGNTRKCGKVQCWWMFQAWIWWRSMSRVDLAAGTTGLSLPCRFGWLVSDEAVFYGGWIASPMPQFLSSTRAYGRCQWWPHLDLQALTLSRSWTGYRPSLVVNTINAVSHNLDFALSCFVISILWEIIFGCNFSQSE